MDLITLVRLIPSGTTIWIELNGESALLDLWELAEHAFYGVKRVSLAGEHLNIQIYEKEPLGGLAGYFGCHK